MNGVKGRPRGLCRIVKAMRRKRPADDERPLHPPVARILALGIHEAKGLGLAPDARHRRMKPDDRAHARLSQTLHQKFIVAEFRREKKSCARRLKRIEKCTDFFNELDP